MPGYAGLGHGNYSDNGYLAQWADGTTGFIAGMLQFLAGLHSSIPIVINAHPGPPNNQNVLYSDVQSLLASESNVGYGMEALSLLDPLVESTRGYPPNGSNWVWDFVSYPSPIRHLQTITGGNYPLSVQFSISSVTVSGGTATLTCSNGNCGTYCNNNLQIYITGNSALNGQWTTAPSCSGATITFSTPGIPNGTYNGGTVWGPQYLNAVLPFALQHGANEIELHECELDYIFGVQTTPSPEGPCIGASGPDTAQQALLNSIILGAPAGTSALRGAVTLSGNPMLQ